MDILFQFYFVGFFLFSNDNISLKTFFCTCSIEEIGTLELLSLRIIYMHFCLMRKKGMQREIFSLASLKFVVAIYNNFCKFDTWERLPVNIVYIKSLIISNSLTLLLHLKMSKLKIR